MALDESKPFIPVRFSVLTVSDTRSLADDKSGDTLAARILEAGHILAARQIAKDEPAEIAGIVSGWAASGVCDAIITTGGTGFTGRDITPETLEPLFAKRMDGFSVAFHTLSAQKIGTSTVQSRATAGLIGTVFVFVLPGSPGACRDAWDGILQPQFDYRHKPCNFVEIMPRLDEHLRRGAGRQSKTPA
jgi:molybdopterin adenylyltransferase